MKFNKPSENEPTFRDMNRFSKKIVRVETGNNSISSTPKKDKDFDNLNENFHDEAEGITMNELCKSHNVV